MGVPSYDPSPWWAALLLFFIDHPWALGLGVLWSLGVFVSGWGLA